MDAYWLDWVNLFLRWAHVVTGIAWIGASFHFVGLDASLRPPADAAERAKGVGGELWAVHGGGFYHQQKYPVAPAVLPESLHWSLWESYSTWLTGFALFTVLYLFNASAFLIDRNVLDWSPAAAAATALAFFVVFWMAYDAICRGFAHLPRSDLVVGLLVVGLVVLTAWAACHLFAGRAAFLIVGAALATAMTANVLMVIIPGQRKVVAALRAGLPVDPVFGRRGKQRSVHNTYFTLPVVFTMLSNHYGFVTTAKHNWLVLLALMLAGALIRLSFVLRHKALVEARPVPWHYAIAGVVVAAVVVGLLLPAVEPPTAAAAAPVPAFVQVEGIVRERCQLCHNAQLAYKNVRLDSAAAIRSHAQDIFQQAVVLKAMPLGNATRITDAERAALGRWYEAGSP
ncbi:MAG: urate hydroxylase PuuD [Pseudomonadota bacterium]|nr:urate hydroxylase PuuD [Pseudomonadota bacterium]